MYCMLQLSYVEPPCAFELGRKVVGGCTSSASNIHLTSYNWSVCCSYTVWSFHVASGLGAGSSGGAQTVHSSASREAAAGVSL